MKARAAKAVGTTVGVPRGARNERDCQSKLYPQHAAPLFPVKRAASKSSSSARTSVSASTVRKRR